MVTIRQRLAGQRFGMTTWRRATGWWARDGDSSIGARWCVPTLCGSSSSVGAWPPCANGNIFANTFCIRSYLQIPDENKISQKFLFSCSFLSLSTYVKTWNSSISSKRCVKENNKLISNPSVLAISIDRRLSHDLK